MVTHVKQLHNTIPYALDTISWLDGIITSNGINGTESVRTLLVEQLLIQWPVSISSVPDGARIATAMGVAATGRANDGDRIMI